MLWDPVHVLNVFHSKNELQEIFYLLGFHLQLSVASIFTGLYPSGVVSHSM